MVDFPEAITVENKVEEWFKKLLKTMQSAVKQRFGKCNQAKIGKGDNKAKLSAYIKEHEGQILITMAQIQWTQDVGTALQQAESGQGNLSGLKKQKGFYKKKVDNYVEYVK